MAGEESYLVTMACIPEEDLQISSHLLSPLTSKHHGLRKKKECGPESAHMGMWGLPRWVTKRMASVIMSHVLQLDSA